MKYNLCTVTIRFVLQLDTFSSIIAKPQTTVHDASKQPAGNKIVVVAIDVGTTYSGYAFSYRSSPKEVFVNNWISHAGDGLSYKAPSSILLNKTYNFVAFGYDAEKKFSEIVQNRNKDNFFFVKDFKTQLANDQVHKTLPLLINCNLHIKVFCILQPILLSLFWSVFKVAWDTTINVDSNVYVDKGTF